MGTAPPFIRTAARASLFEVIKYWAPYAGFTEETLRRTAARRLCICLKEDGPPGTGCCGRLVLSLRFFGTRKACCYYRTCDALETSDAAADGASRDLAIDADGLAWLAKALTITPPPWLEEWRKHSPALLGPLGVPHAKGDGDREEPPSDWHKRAIDLLRERGSPARKRGGWYGFAYEVCPTAKPGTVIRFAWRWLAKNESDKSDK